VTVSRVVDGDTIEISPAVEGVNEVRLIGVDTPETKDPNEEVEPFGPEASEFATSELQGQEVGVELDAETTDRYGRLLAYVYLGEAMFNETLIEEGYAQVWFIPPNTLHEAKFFGAQDGARAGLAGIWALPLEQQCLLANHGNGIGEGEPGCVQEQPPQYAPEPQPAPSAPAVPGGDVDCSDFSSSLEAQDYLLPGDPHRLDADGDGQACDSLP
jgi:micrococcal nuclease